MNIVQSYCLKASMKNIRKKVDDQKALACKPGAYRFTDAMLLAMPDITNAHNYPYQLVSCHEILDELRKEAQLFGGENAINEAIECGGGMTSIIDGDERIMLDVNNFYDILLMMNIFL